MSCWHAELAASEAALYYTLERWLPFSGCCCLALRCCVPATSFTLLQIFPAKTQLTITDDFGNVIRLQLNLKTMARQSVREGKCFYHYIIHKHMRRRRRQPYYSYNIFPGFLFVQYSIYRLIEVKNCRFIFCPAANQSVGLPAV